MQSSKPAPMTEVPLFRATVSFGTPMVIAMGLGALFNLVDLYITHQIAVYD